MYLKDPIRSNATLLELAAECRALNTALASTKLRTRAQRADMVRHTRCLLGLVEQRLEPPEPAPIDQRGDNYSGGGGLATEAISSASARR